MQTSENEFLNWISSSDSMFDIAFFEGEELPSNVRVIGPNDIDADFKTAFPKKVGALNTEKVQRILQRVAARVATRVAASQSDNLNVSVGGLTHAWFHPIFSELASLVPIRHLAREYARNSTNVVFAIRTAAQPYCILNSWSANFIEPFYLASELRRKGIPAFLLLTEDLKAQKLSYYLSNKWLPKGFPRYFVDSDISTVISKNAMRRPGLVANATNARKRRQPGFFSRVFGSSFHGKSHGLEIKLSNGPSIPGIRVYSAPQNAPTLDMAFTDVFGPFTKRVADWYHSELDGKGVQVAHVADHASLEGGLLAAEVARQGGKVHLSPHSANVVHMEAHDPASLSRVTVAARSTGEYWAEKFGRDKVVVDPVAILPDTPPAAAFEQQQPLHIVLFAGSHFLRRVPLFSYEGHKATWEKTLNTLLKADVELIVKHKSAWETREWIAARAPADSRIRFSNVHANKLRWPNMVFLCISSTSTAIFEGIARGVPGLVVRDISVDETPHYDSGCVPYLSSRQLGPAIAKLKSKTAWDELRAKQMAWFKEETSPLPSEVTGSQNTAEN